MFVLIIQNNSYKSHLYIQPKPEETNSFNNFLPIELDIVEDVN